MEFKPIKLNQDLAKMMVEPIQNILKEEKP